MLASEHDIQKMITPFMKSPALRRVIQTFTNGDAEDGFQKWAGNKQVPDKLAEAKRMAPACMHVDAGRVHVPAGARHADGGKAHAR